jgi:uncharacterized membrane protein YdjX (TVP38/TMEM64 family)
VFDLEIKDADNFQKYLRDLGIWSRLAYTGSVFLEVLIAFIPGWIIYPAGSAVFGFTQTVILVLIGNLLGASVSFWIGRRWGQPLLRKFIASKYTQKFDAYMQQRGSLSIFFLKLNPLTSLDIWNYMAGASPMPFWKFTVANMLGITPLIVISSLLGEKTFEIAPQLMGVLIILTIIYAAWFIVNLPGKLARARRKE